MTAGAWCSLGRCGLWRDEARFTWVYESSGQTALGQLESLTGGTGQGCLSLMRRRISLAKTKPWIPFGSVFSALEWEGGGETLTWESMKSAWSPHRNTLVTKTRGGAGGSGGALGPRGPGCGLGMWLLQLRSSDLGPGMREELVRMTVTLTWLEGKASPWEGTRSKVLASHIHPFNSC